MQNETNNEVTTKFNDNVTGIYLLEINYIIFYFQNFAILIIN